VNADTARSIDQGNGSERLTRRVDGRAIVDDVTVEAKRLDDPRGRAVP